MGSDLIVLLAEDDMGHASLIQKNLKRSGISNEVVHFLDGEEVLNFLFRKGDGPHRESGIPYLLLLDIRMPKINGIEVLTQIKEDAELKKLPVIMLTTTNDPREIEKCHALGCSNYISKPVEYEKFTETIQQLGLFLKIVQIPKLNGELID
ncbi:MAG: response regulator [Chloroflexi bacterium]|nr:response regulator [Chloroflexota bacterium]